MPAPHDQDPQFTDPDVARLIRAAGRRADPPAAAYERTLAATTAVWQNKLRSRQRRQVFSAAAAALILVTAAILFTRHSPSSSSVTIGRTDRIIGTVEVLNDDRWVVARDEEQPLLAGTHVRTRVGSLAGLIVGAASIRLADATDVVLESGSRVRVLAGRIYLDSGSTNALQDARSITVVTAAGSASDLGTQFEVQYRDSVYRLRVREGRVALSSRTGDIDSGAGEQVTINARGAIERTHIAPADEDWQWAQSLAPAPDIDNQPLAVLLSWVARETGRKIRFTAPDVEDRALTTVLHGNIRHLTPLDALSVMLATTDLEYVMPDSTSILIRLKNSH